MPTYTITNTNEDGNRGSSEGWLVSGFSNKIFVSDANYCGGWSFPIADQIPAGSTITSAYFRVSNDGGQDDTSNTVSVCVEDTDPATQAIFSSGNLPSLTTTGSIGFVTVGPVTWAMGYCFGSADLAPANLTTAVQALLDTYGTIEIGNRINITVVYSAGAGFPAFFDFDDAGTDEAQLIIEWTSGTSDQEGFRWGVDDGSESAHTFEAAQDTSISIASNQARLLRCLVDSAGDLTGVAYTLRSQKNGSGGYTAVPVGATQVVTPVIESGDATVTTIGTAGDPWAINVPDASTGDLLIFVIAWDDSTTVTTVTPPAGQNSETISSIVGPAASNGTEMRIQAWSTVCTGAWTAGTISFDPSASETCRSVVMRVPAGEFDATPIGASSSSVSAGTAETNINSPAYSAGSTDGGGRLMIAFGSDADAITAPASGTSTVNNATGGGVGLCVVTRDAQVTNSESIAAITATIAGDSWATVAFVVRGPTVNNEVYVTTSGNITGGGEATTARLTAPSGKTTSDFTTGRRWDDENGTDSIDIAEDFYTEVEWNVALASGVTGFFDFRVYAGSSALSTYGVTPRWTVPSGGFQSASARGSNTVIVGT
jgi:hypothetical protein